LAGAEGKGPLVGVADDEGYGSDHDQADGTPPLLPLLLLVLLDRNRLCH
jgi:hypothetical protein